MEDLHIIQVHQEQCTPDKSVINGIISSNMLHFVTAGKGVFNGITVYAGQIFLARAMTLNFWYPDPTQPWSYSWINTIGAASDRLLAECGFSDSCLVLNVAFSDEMQMLLHMIRDTENEYLQQELFISLIGLIKTGGKSVLSEPQRHMRSAISLIEASGGRITPGELSHQLNLSRAYLRNLFMQTQGVSAQEYILRLRISRAADLLLHTDYPIGIIGASVGYEDPLQFSRMFRRRMGCSPKQYRQNRS